ncbi:MFS transporter [Tumidithrix elongata RA019]|uniref:MFS transporter n=1 Tax=Tumidithrix elongata BACA0141 TaxID=2716417 RepID=A0AAW9Q4F9_9CYAN|nr:MFS transporter [Tumidithrix elongata RA019]
MGWLSDRTVSKWGKRHAWMIFGAIPFGVLFGLQWIVPHFSEDSNLNQTLLFWYYVVTSVLGDAAFTVVFLPYYALIPDLTQDYHERTSLNSFKLEWFYLFSSRPTRTNSVYLCPLVNSSITAGMMKGILRVCNQRITGALFASYCTIPKMSILGASSDWMNRWGEIA